MRQRQLVTICVLDIIFPVRSMYDFYSTGFISFLYLRDF